MSVIFFDLGIALLLILAVVQGYRKGFVLTLCGFLAVFVAFFGATFLSNQLAQPVSDAIRPAIQQSISAALERSLEEGAIESQSSTSVPGQEVEEFSLDQIVHLLGDSAWVQSVADSVEEAINQGIMDVTSGAVQAIADYVARELARLVLFLLCFILILVGWFLLSHALDLAFKLPVLSTLNHWSGAALGLVKGSVLLFIACWLLQGLLPKEAIQETYLLKFFCTTNPFALLASFFA